MIRVRVDFLVDETAYSKEDRERHVTAEAFAQQVVGQLLADGLAEGDVDGWGVAPGERVSDEWVAAWRAAREVAG